MILTNVEWHLLVEVINRKKISSVSGLQQFLNSSEYFLSDTLVFFCASLLRKIFASLARANERVHIHNVRDAKACTKPLLEDANLWPWIQWIEERFESLSFEIVQEPITRSFHLPYWPSKSTLSRIFLFLEAPPTKVFAVVFIIANHKRAVVLDCYTSHADHTKILQ